MYSAVRPRKDLARRLRDESGIDVDACDGTGACTGACPFAESMDLAPHQLIRAIQLGDDGRVLRSGAPWICTDCLACTGACPTRVDVGRVFDRVRALARETDAIVPPEVESVKKLHEAFVDELAGNGRVNETHLAVSYKARSFDPGDLTLALGLLRRGRLRPFAREKSEGFTRLLDRVRDRREPG